MNKLINKETPASLLAIADPYSFQLKGNPSLYFNDVISANFTPVKALDFQSNSQSLI
jgi:hypothetical protein